MDNKRASQLLNIEDIHTYYGESYILQGVSLSVGEGEIVCLLGRNGAGKTTLMRSIIGLSPPASGMITFQHEKINNLPPYRIADKGIGYVPQGQGIFAELTVLENIRLGLRKKRLKSHPEIDKVFQYFPILKDRITQKGGTLSGGERQMLAIGRGLVGGIRLMLLDEPTEGIQPSIIHQLKEIIKRINEEMDLSILIVEQNIELALDVGNRYYVMQNGTIVESGCVDNIERTEMIEKYLTI